MSIATAPQPTGLSRSDRWLGAAALAAVVLAGITRYADVGAVLAFFVSALAVALLATIVGRAVEQIAERLGAGATGVLQSALGNLPELFISIFALREGLTRVVKAAIVGSILANVLLVLGLGFVVGGLKHGTQRFSSERARTITTLMLLAVAGMLVPSFTASVHTPAAQHEGTVSVITSLVLLAVFALSVPASLQKQLPGPAPASGEASEPEAARWSTRFAVVVLAVTGVGAALVSEWFVYALQPAMETLHISETFAGLVIVAIAGNAVENVAGVQLAARNQADHALSVILNSPLQIALVLAPVLVLVSYVVAPVPLTLVLAPALVMSLVAAVLVAALLIYDGESIWLEGAALIGLYVLIAASFWWG